MCKIKIEQAYPQFRMLERPRSFAYEVYAWKVNYLIVPKNAGCASCKIRPGSIVLPITGMSYTKSDLAKFVKEKIDLK